MLSVTKVDLWSAPIEDRPGGLLVKLEPLVKVGVDLEFVLGRENSARAGEGLLILSPLVGQQQVQAAEQCGLRRNSGLYCLRLEGPDEPGYAYRILFALAVEKLNLQELAAIVLNNQFVMYVAFEKAEEADRAMRRLQVTL